MEEDLPQKDRIDFKQEYRRILDDGRRRKSTLPEINLIIDSLIVRLIGVKDIYERQLILAETGRKLGFSNVPQLTQAVRLAEESKTAPQTATKTAQQLQQDSDDSEEDERRALANLSLQVAAAGAVQQNAGSNPVTLSNPNAENEIEAEREAQIEAEALRIEEEATQARQRIQEEEKIAAQQKKELAQRNNIELGKLRQKYGQVEGKGLSPLTTTINKMLRGLTIKKQPSGTAITAENKTFIQEHYRKISEYANIRIKQKLKKITYQDLEAAPNVRFTEFVDFYIGYKLLKTMATNPFIIATLGDIADILSTLYSGVVDEGDRALIVFLDVVNMFLTNGFTKEAEVKKEPHAEYKDFYKSLEKEPKPRKIQRSPTKPDLPNIK